MKYLVVKTAVQTGFEFSRISDYLNHHPAIDSWNIDLEDVDRVLRVLPSYSLTENELVGMIRQEGYHCETLPD